MLIMECKNKFYCGLVILWNSTTSCDAFMYQHHGLRDTNTVFFSSRPVFQWEKSQNKHFGLYIKYNFKKCNYNKKSVKVLM